MGFSLKKAVKKAVSYSPIGGFGTLEKMFKGQSPEQQGMLDTTQYQNTYDQLAQQGGAGDYADIETFYTPEMQQAVLAEMDRASREGGSRVQAGISGNAVLSGWGVGNTSREAARRASAESDMMNQIIQGHIANAQGIESQRAAQAQELAQRKANAAEMIAGNKQSSELAQLGYQEALNQQNQQFKQDAYAQRMGQISGAIGSIGGALGSYAGSQGQAGSTVTPIGPRGPRQTPGGYTYIPNFLGGD